MSIRSIVVVGLAMLVAMPGGIAVASGLETIVDFDPAAAEFPEGIAVDKTGDLYVSLTLRDEIRRIDPSGNQTVLTTFHPGTGPAGLAVDAKGVVYAAAGGLDLSTGETDPTLRGVYRIERDGTTERLPGTEAITLPNDVTLDKRGSVYATDTVAGAVWRLPRGGSAELWAQDPLLEGTGGAGFGFPLGANGIAFHHDRIVVANTERGLLVEIPVESDGSAGDPTILAESAALVTADGIALDVHGDVYVGVSFDNTVVRVGADGAIETLATSEDGLNQPSTLAFGAGRRDNQTLFVANFSLFAPEPTPAVLALPVGVPGQPLP